MMGQAHGYTAQLIQRLEAEHREILAEFDALVALGERGPVDRSILVHLAWTIYLHDRAEDAIVFPALDGSYALGRHIRAEQHEHRIIETQFEDLELRFSLGGEWLQQARTLRAFLLRHFAHEEDVVFARAATVLDPLSDELLLRYEQERTFLLHPS